MSLPFAGLVTFAMVPRDDPGEPPVPDAAVLGIPTDEATTQHPGARYGPRAIREASTQFPFFKRGRGYYDPNRGRPMLTELTLRDAGDVDIVPTLREENGSRITAAVSALRDRGILPVCLGGDHSITPAILAAYSDTPLHLIQLDAHLDFAEHLEGATDTHASPMRRARELSHLRSLTQLGIRSIVSSPADFAAARSARNVIVSTEQFLAAPEDDWWGGLGGPAYLTLDIDVLDPAVAPGTGFAEPGGLSFRDVSRLVRRLAHRVKLVGFDLVEMNPYLDGSRRTAVVAARLVLDILSAIFDPPTPP
ncbi:MAG: arginase family protein [candidate division NC10 bacterium]|nr:arginase family protein [candidate division NC10 bacterium]